MTFTHNRALRFVACAVLVACSSGCGSIEHISVLRDAQETFSFASEQGNRLTLSHVLPTEHDLRNQGRAWQASSDARLSSSYDDPTSANSYLAYANVAATLAALNRNSADQLKADRLYGTSLTLQVLAEWKAAFFAQLLSLEKADRPASTTDANGRTITLLAETPSFLDVRARGKQALEFANANDLPLFSRDRFLLEALEPLVRYDNAFIHALRYEREGKIFNLTAGASPTTSAEVDARNTQRTSVLAGIKEIVEQMALAEEQLARLPVPANAEHIKPYVATARLAMIQTAIKLTNWSAVGTKWTWDSDNNRLVTPTWSASEARTSLERLVDRRDKMLTDVANQTTAIGALVIRLRLHVPTALPPLF